MTPHNPSIQVFYIHLLTKSYGEREGKKKRSRGKKGKKFSCKTLSRVRIAPPEKKKKFLKKKKGGGKGEKGRPCFDIPYNPFSYYDL